jgi:hypothetical protein
LAAEIAAFGWFDLVEDAPEAMHGGRQRLAIVLDEAAQRSGQLLAFLIAQMKVRHGWK